MSRRESGVPKRWRGMHRVRAAKAPLEWVNHLRDNAVLKISSCNLSRMRAAAMFAATGNNHGESYVNFLPDHDRRGLGS